MRIAKWKNLKKEELESIVKKCFSISEVLREFGYYCSGGVHKEVKNYLILNKIPTDHFKRLPRGTPISPKEMFCENSLISRGAVKREILRKNMIPHQCNDCGIGTTWNGKNLVLVLDHKNGRSQDNRIENLRFLCPNCNSQTETFAGKNSNKKNNLNELKKGYLLDKKLRVMNSIKK